MRSKSPRFGEKNADINLYSTAKVVSIGPSLSHNGREKKSKEGQNVTMKSDTGVQTQHKFKIPELPL